MELDTLLNVKIDRKTADFLKSLRDHENINVSAWVRDAIRRKAGLKPDAEPKAGAE